MTSALSGPGVATIGLAVATVGLLAGCASPTHATSATSPATPAVSMPSPTRAMGADAAPAADGATPGVKPVNCGKVGPDGGEQVDLIAESTPAGRVGCTEAINVITDYYRDAPAKAEGTARRLVVQGWSCVADTGASGTGSIRCDKDGFAFHTEP